MQSGLCAVRVIGYHRGDVVGVVILAETGSGQMAPRELHVQHVQAAVDRAAR